MIKKPWPHTPKHIRVHIKNPNNKDTQGLFIRFLYYVRSLGSQTCARSAQKPQGPSRVLESMESECVIRVPGFKLCGNRTRLRYAGRPQCPKPQKTLPPTGVSLLY